MGNQSWVGCGNGGDATIHSPFSSPTIYAPMGGPSPVQPLVTTPTQATCRGGMTLSGMAMQFNQITGTTGEIASMSAGVSIAGASTPGNQSCVLSSHPVVTNGPFTLTDTTHTDAIADGTTYGMVYAGISGTATGIVTPSVAFEQIGASNNYVTLSAFAAPMSGVNSSSKYIPLVGTLHIPSSGLEVQTQLQLPYAVTLDHMQFAITANGGSITVTSRIGAASGNQTVTTTSTSGAFEDTTHTDAAAAGALANYMLHATSNSTFTMCSMRAVSANPVRSGLFAAIGGGAQNSNSPTYCPFIGVGRCDPTLGETVINTPFNGVLSLLNVTLTSNTSGTASTFTLMKGSMDTGSDAAGNQTLVFAADQATTLVDTTHTDALVAGTDMVALGVTGATVNALEIQAQAALFTAPGGATTPQPDGMTLMGVG